MIPYWMSRTQLMLGDEAVSKLMGKNVLVIGLGGVGGICAEMIVRAGVGKMTIVDNDTCIRSCTLNGFPLIVWVEKLNNGVAISLKN